MELTPWVDVAIGLTIVYLGTSLYVTIVNEYIAQLLNLRGRDLWKALEELIDDEEVRSRLRTNPALEPFFESRPIGIFEKLKKLFFFEIFTSKRRPSAYIDPNVLSRILVGFLATPDQTPASQPGAQILENLKKIGSSKLRTQLQAVVRSASGEMGSLVTAVSDWADRSLTMLGETYKRRMQWISFVIGLIVTVTFNLDTIALVTHLYRDKESREAAAAIAVRLIDQTQPDTVRNCVKSREEPRAKSTIPPDVPQNSSPITAPPAGKPVTTAPATPSGTTSQATCASISGLVEAIQSRNETLGKLPIGWSAAPDSWLSPLRLIGWLLTALAVSLGAPFWFDLLNRLVNARHSMVKPEVQEVEQKKK